MVAVLAVGFVANLLIKPVDARFHEPEGDHTPISLSGGPSHAGWRRLC